MTPWEREQRSARWSGPVAWLLFIALVVGLCIAVGWAFGSHWEDGRKRAGEAPSAPPPARTQNDPSGRPSGS